MYQKNNKTTYIYKLVHKDDMNDDNIYIGRTSNIYKRSNLHKYSCNNPNNLGFYTKKASFIRENGGWDEWNMIIIAEYNIDCRSSEAKQKEDEYYIFYNSSLNTNSPTFDNKKSLQYKKQYYQDNKEYKKQYYQDKKEYLQEYALNRYKQKKEYWIKYYEANKDKIKTNYKLKRKNNKDER
jgi:hypothetical protein